MAGHQLLSRFLANGQFLRVSRQSLLSANDKGDYEMIPRAVHISPDIYLTNEEKPWRTLPKRPWIKAVRSFIASNGIPYIKMMSVGYNSMRGRERKGKKDRMAEPYSILAVKAGWKRFVCWMRTLSVAALFLLVDKSRLKSGFTSNLSHLTFFTHTLHQKQYLYIHSSSMSHI